MSTRPSDFSILYYNARSLLPKLSELQLIAEAYSPSVICIVETWLSPNIINREVSILAIRLCIWIEIVMVGVCVCTFPVNSNFLFYLVGEAWSCFL